MHLLEQAQANFIATINEGPDALDHCLFAGPIDRVLLGLKAHANTISHARLVALEETFPLTRQALGEEPFNQLSRAYVETAAARAFDSNAIGKGFAEFLVEGGAGPSNAELAAIEWAWLKSYHAVEALPLGLPDFAGLTEDQLLRFAVRAHPAAHMISITAPLSDQLAEITAVIANPAAILAIRPEAEVRLVPLDAATVAVFAASKKASTLGNLLALAAEQPDITDPSGPVITLLGAGALMENRDARDHPLL
jgi:hypothetical protein